MGELVGVGQVLELTPTAAGKVLAGGSFGAVRGGSLYCDEIGEGIALGGVVFVGFGRHDVARGGEGDDVDVVVENAQSIARRGELADGNLNLRLFCGERMFLIV